MQIHGQVKNLKSNTFSNSRLHSIAALYRQGHATNILGKVILLAQFDF
jgi:hypothetical protein